MKVSELGYIKIIADDKPQYISVPESHILADPPGTKQYLKGYEPMYFINLSPTFSITYKNNLYYPDTNIFAYHGPAEIDLYKNRNQLGNVYARVNNITITNLKLLDFDIQIENYELWERAQAQARQRIFGEI